MKKIILMVLLVLFCSPSFAGLEMNPITGKLDKTNDTNVTEIVSEVWEEQGNNVYLIDTSQNVGIGTINPAGKLHVAGPFVVEGDFSGILLDYGQKIDGDTSRKFTFSDTIGTYNSNFRLDLDTTSGVASFDSSSTVPIEEVEFVDMTVTATAFVGDGSGLTGISGGGSVGWTDGGTNVYATTTSDRVAIGTTTPSAGSKLQVVGTVSATAFVGDGSGLTGIVGGGGLGNVVEDTTPQLGGDLDMNAKNIDFPSTANISDVLDEDNMASNSATKLATQQSIKAYVDTAISGVSGGAGGWTDGGANVYLTATSDIVGVGTTTPNAQLMISNVGTGDSFRVDDALNDTTPFLITSAGNVGIGTSSPSSPFQFGTASASNFISMSTASAPAMAIRADSASTVDLLNIQSSGISSGNALEVSSSSASQTVPLALFTQSAASSGGTLRVNQSSASSTGRATHITNAGTGDTFLVEDVATDSSPFIIGSDGNVGIGTTTVSANKLRVVGNIDATSFSGDGSALTGISGGSSGWTDGTAVIYTTTSTDNVGIGTFNPLQRLQVVGTVQATAFVTNSTVAGSLVLNEDNANGVNTITISAPSSISSNRSCALEDDSTPFDNCVTPASGGWTDAGATINVTTSTDNVGIGTSSPEKKLVLAGADSDMRIKSTTSSVHGELQFFSDLGESFNIGVGGSTTSPASEAFFENVISGAPVNFISNAGRFGFNAGTGTGQITIDGDTGGCLMFQDTDNAGWTECDALNGSLTCSTDADGICD